MTIHPTADPEPRREGWSFGYRDFPPCACPDPGCDGRPEAGRPVAPGFTLQPPPRGGRSDPPGETYRPGVGELVLDTLHGRPGVVMQLDAGGPVAHLRPERGGCEWETDARWLARPPHESP